MRKKKTTKTKVNWKKIILGAVTAITLLLVVSFLGILLWMQTWKTYVSSEGFSIKYPQNWVYADSTNNNMGIWGLVAFSDADAFRPIVYNETTSTIFLNIKVSERKQTELKIADQALNAFEAHKQLFQDEKNSLQKININNKEVYLLSDPAGALYFIADNKDNVLLLNSVLNSRGNIFQNKFNLFIVRLMVHTMRFEQE